MPKIIVHAPEGTFDAPARRQVAGLLATLGLECEALPMSPFVKSTVWTYFKADAPDAVFMGHKPATMKIISLQVYVIEGGLDEDGKRKLISDAIEILGRYSDARDRLPVYVAIHDAPEINWGICGETANIAAARVAIPGGSGSHLRAGHRRSHPARRI